MLTIGSLFSGIGGLDLGLEWAGLGPTLWQVEIDPFCRSVLARHWPNAVRHDDVKAVGASNLEPVDLICGGFPCQDVSSAGAGAGLAGRRSGLWFEFARIVGELHPAWVVVENVASGAQRWVDEVVFGLEKLGYETLPIPLSAADVGAPHLRRRIFVVAYADRVDVRQQQGRRCGTNGAGQDELGDDGQARVVAYTHRDSKHAEPIDGQVGWPCQVAVSPDALCQRLQGPWDAAHQRQRRRTGSTASAWADEPMPEPALRPLDDGVSDRVARIRALGNAVVPQCAEVVGWVVRELM